MLRSMSWVAGIGSVLIAVPLSRRLFTATAARLLFVAIIALHPAAIDLSKEFKPYSLSLGFLPFGSALSHPSVHEHAPAARDLAFHVAGLPTSAFLVFAGSRVRAPRRVLGARRRRLGLGDRSRLAWLFAFGLGIVATLGAQYFLIWRHIGSSAHAFWGEKYGVFFTRERRGESYLDWWLDRYAGLVELPDLRRRFWQAAWLSSKTLDWRDVK